MEYALVIKINGKKTRITNYLVILQTPKLIDRNKYREKIIKPKNANFKNKQIEKSG